MRLVLSVCPASVHSKSGHLAIYMVKRLLNTTETLKSKQINVCVPDSDQTVSILRISSAFLFNMVRLAICNTAKNSITTEGGHTRSQDTGFILEYTCM